MRPISERVSSLKPSGIRRFFDLVKAREDVISLGVGEPDFPTPRCIREAGIFSLEKGETMYTSNYGLLELRQALASYLKKQYRLSYQGEDEILITVGVSEAMDLALRAILNPQDEVIVHQPSYVSYLPDIILSGGVPVSIPLTPSSGFKLTPGKLRSAITDKTKAIILNYPNNPTGAVMSRGDLEKLAAVAKEYDLFVISDEIYGQLTYSAGGYIPFSSLPGMKKRTIFLNGFSKAYSMTGWRLGYAAGDKDIIDAMMRVHQYTMLCAPTIAQLAALEAIDSGGEDVERMREEYDQRRRFIYKAFCDMDLECVEPEGAFYIFPSIASCGLNSLEFSERLLKEENVAVVPGDAFGECGEGFIRCSYATSFDNLREALRRIGRFVKRCRK